MIEQLERALAPRLSTFALTPRSLLLRDAPGGLGPPGRFSANGQCRLIKALDGWVALNLARADDVELIPALVGETGEPWQILSVAVAREPAFSFRDRAIELQLPVAVAGEAMPIDLAPAVVKHVPRRVVDMSALWAGPLCGALLARMGADVLRIDSVGRPDPTPISSPRLDAFINGDKRRLALDLRRPDDRKRLRGEIAGADVLITSARPLALAEMGIEPGAFPHLAWVAITGHGFTGPGAVRVGFGDDCAVAGGLHGQHAGQLQFLGDALADPLTGLEAAWAVLSGRSGLIDLAMARVAATYATQCHATRNA